MTTTKSAKKGNYPIPFDAEGNQLHYAETWRRDLEWRDNHVFDATLRYAGYCRGRSAAYMLFVRVDTLASVVVFLGDFDPVVARMVKGEVSGRFTFCKRGQNYGCCLVDEGEIK